MSGTKRGDKLLPAGYFAYSRTLEMTGAAPNGKSLGRPFKLAPHQRRDDSGDETLAEIGRSYNVNNLG